jgi:formylglycine-generating enzyme required for sulfatase activity
MVYVPGGSGAKSIYGFFIRKREVSVAEYIEFWKTFPENIRDSKTIYFYCDERHKFFPLWDKNGSVTQPYRTSDPVFGVSVSDAQAYCRWLSKKSGRLIRLPILEEWVRASFDFDEQSSVSVYGVENLSYTIREMLGGGKLDLNKKHIGFRYVMDMKKR